MKEFQLPIRKYYSIENTIKRWDCDKDDFWYYVETEKSLRLAMSSLDVSCRNFLDPPLCLKLTEQEARIAREVLGDTMWCSGITRMDHIDIEEHALDILASALGQSVTEITNRLEHSPEFLYIQMSTTLICSPTGEMSFGSVVKKNPNDLKDATISPVTILFEDFEGNDLILFEEHLTTKKYQICYRRLHDDAEGFEFVTFEERTRFENLASKGKEEKTKNALSPRTENCYLRTIEALVDKLIGGLSSQHHSNAEACLSLFGEKEMSFPIKKDALANYLKAAKDLSKK